MLGKAVQEQDAVGEAIGVVHLLDRFLAPLLGQFEQTPVVQQPEMQPVLVDGGEFAAQTLVEIFDDLGVALHDAFSLLRPDETGLSSGFRMLLNQIAGGATLLPGSRQRIRIGTFVDGQEAASKNSV